MDRGINLVNNCNSTLFQCPTKSRINLNELLGAMPLQIHTDRTIKPDMIKFSLGWTTSCLNDYLTDSQIHTLDISTELVKKLPIFQVLFGDDAIVAFKLAYENVRRDRLGTLDQ